MSEFNLETYLNNLSLQELKSLKKSELQKIVTHFKLLFTMSSKKGKINRLVTQHLVDEELVPEPEDEIGKPKSPVVDSGVVELKSLEVELHERE